MVVLYKRKNYKILGTYDNSYIIWNTRKPFESGHTHISNYKLAKKIIDTSIRRIIPDNEKPFFIKSLLRLCNPTDGEYRNRLNIALNSITEQTKK